MLGIPSKKSNLFLFVVVENWLLTLRRKSKTLVFRYYLIRNYILALKSVFQTFI